MLAGRPFPLGSHPEGGGVRFAVASSTAEAVEVCLLDNGSERRIELTERTFGVWHGVLRRTIGEPWASLVFGGTLMSATLTLFSILGRTPPQIGRAHV